MFIFEFLKIVMFMCLSFGLSGLLLFIGLQISPKTVDFEKLSAYECGFTPVGDARQPFHVRFYLVGILFLLFDLEVIFLFPWALTMHSTMHTVTALTNVMLFLTLLTVGFVYEWRKGALDWE
jgi:NADH-quinone oxidoreductase subunit A